MNHWRNTGLSAATFLISTAAVVAAGAGLAAGVASWVVYLGLLAIGAGMGLAGLWQIFSKTARQNGAFERLLDTICQLDPRGVRSDDWNGLPPLAEGHPLRPAAQRLWQAFVESCRGVQDLEQARSAAEIRCRRLSADYERIRSILAGLPDPILVVDQYDDVVLTNPSAERLFGIPGDSAEQRALARLVQCEKLVALLTGTAHRKNSGNRYDDVEVLDADGRSLWFRATATRLTEGAGSLPGGGAVAVLRDIGDQRALQKRNAEFVSAVSHEMKTPLAGIKAYVELLADGDAEDEPTREGFLEVINSQADRLQRLVDNMLNLARIEAGVVSVNKKGYSLNELLEEAARVVSPAAEAKQIELVRDLSPLYLGVLADRDMLLQAAINLLSNAVKYTPAHGRVTLRSRLADDQPRFDVSDTGVGLSPEDAVRIFEKFYRVQKDKTMAPGTGLGLPLAKHIVEDVHGGRLTVESELDKGSTFSVTLPSAGQIGM